MNKLLILVVEDDTSVRNLITTTLKSTDYNYISAENGEIAIAEAASHNPDIVLLDLGLPDIDGIEVIKRIRSWSDMPIIVISARAEDDDKIAALDSGADDYLTKPFSVQELLARVRVAARRIASANAGNSESVITNGPLKVDFAMGCAFMNDQELHLTPMEYKILCLLIKNIDKVLTYTYIVQNVWGNSLDSDIASLRVYMTTLRKKLEKENNNIKFIQTHIGIGYRMVKID